MLCFFEGLLLGVFRLMYAFSVPGSLAFGVKFSDIWLPEGGLGSLFGPFWMPWASLDAPGTSSVDFFANKCSKMSGFGTLRLSLRSPWAPLGSLLCSPEFHLGAFCSRNMTICYPKSRFCQFLKTCVFLCVFISF